MKILTQNSKLKKDPRFNIWGLDLAPYNTSGYNTCKHAGKCAEVCIGLHSGLNVMPTSIQAKINKTHMFFEEREKFFKFLHYDLNKLNNSEDERLTLVRGNVDSDLPWEVICPDIFNYSNITFFDYTKYTNRAIAFVKKELPKNYELTYSYNEKSDLRKVNYILKKGGRINLVSSIRYKYNDLKSIPDKVKIGTKTWKTVDGDLHDARLNKVDGKGKVVIVRAKTKKSLIPHYVKSGFFVDLSDCKSKIRAA